MHKSRFLILFTLFCTLSWATLRADDCHHSKGRSDDNFFPGIRFVTTPVFTSLNSAVSFLGEAGKDNFRISGTLGFIPCEQHRFKVSAEYLSQRLNYHFSSGHVRHWMHQFATGAQYQYWLDCGGYLRGLEAGATYSHAPSKDLRKAHCHSSGATIFRNIAGSWSTGGTLGGIFTPWECSSLTIVANYDYVVYKRHFHSDKHISGFGASFDWDQYFWNDFSLNLKAELRKPFHYFEGQLNWHTFCGPDTMAVGIYAGYTRGRDKLPSSTSVGLAFNYAFGVESSCFNPCPDACDTSCCVCDISDMASWVSSPAVYMPEVLAISDQRRRCPKPVASTIPTISFSQPFEFDVSSFFTSPNGEPLTFTAEQLPPNSTLSPDGILSGIPTFPPLIQVYETVIVASNGCGSVKQSFIVIYAANF